MYIIGVELCALELCLPCKATCIFQNSSLDLVHQICRFFFQPSWYFLCCPLCFAGTFLHQSLSLVMLQLFKPDNYGVLRLGRHAHHSLMLVLARFSQPNNHTLQNHRRRLLSIAARRMRFKSGVGFGTSIYVESVSKPDGRERPRHVVPTACICSFEFRGHIVLTTAVVPLSASTLPFQARK